MFLLCPSSRLFSAQKPHAPPVKIRAFFDFVIFLNVIFERQALDRFLFVKTVAFDDKPQIRLIVRYKLNQRLNLSPPARSGQALVFGSPIVERIGAQNLVSPRVNVIERNRIVNLKRRNRLVRRFVSFDKTGDARPIAVFRQRLVIGKKSGQQKNQKQQNPRI